MFHNYCGLYYIAESETPKSRDHWFTGHAVRNNEAKLMSTTTFAICRYAWGDGRTDPLPTVLDRNLFVSNYFALAPVDNDDGSNGYIETNNWLL